jgi:preprotein translocase subunit YajC
MLHLLMVLADEGAKQPEQQPNPLGQMLPVGIMLLVLFYFLLIRPARRQEQERQALLSNLKKNDEVLTAGGIYGTVVTVSETEDKVTLRVDDNVRIKVTKGSIQRNFTNEEAARAAKDAGKTSKETAKEGGS